MSAWIAWSVLAVALLAAELLTGTFHLLVLSIALASAALAALLGAPLAIQLAIAAALGIGGSVALRRASGRRRGALPAEAEQGFDLGQRVHVPEWRPDRTARASYRGSEWDVELELAAAAALGAGQVPLPGDYRIVAIRANRLVLVPDETAGTFAADPAPVPPPPR